MNMRRGEATLGVVVSIVSAIGVMVGSVWISTVAPYLLGLGGGFLHAIAAHEHGVKFDALKIMKLSFVSLFGGWIGMKLAHSISWLSDYQDIVMVIGGFLSWEILMMGYDRKDSLAGQFFDKITPSKKDE